MVCPTGGFGGTFGGPTGAVAGAVGTVADTVGGGGAAAGIGVGTVTGAVCAGGVGAGVGIVVWFVVILLICFNCVLAPQRVCCFCAVTNPLRWNDAGVNQISFKFIHVHGCGLASVLENVAFQQFAV